MIKLFFLILLTQAMFLNFYWASFVFILFQSILSTVPGKYFLSFTSLISLFLLINLVHQNLYIILQTIGYELNEIHKISSGSKIFYCVLLLHLTDEDWMRTDKEASIMINRRGWFQYCCTWFERWIHWPRHRSFVLDLQRTAEECRNSSAKLGWTVEEFHTTV